LSSRTDVRDLSQGHGSHRVICVIFASTVRFLA